MLVALLCWLLVGLIIGAVAGKMVNLRDDHPRIDMLVGAVAAAVGGFAFRMLSHTNITGPVLWSLVIAVGVTIAVLIIWHSAALPRAPECVSKRRSWRLWTYGRARKMKSSRRLSSGTEAGALTRRRIVSVQKGGRLSCMIPVQWRPCRPYASL